MASQTPPSQQKNIWLKTFDGVVQEVELKAAIVCPFLAREVSRERGFSRTSAIQLPNEVGSSSLELILEYCSSNQGPGHSDKELKLFRLRFIKLDQTRLKPLLTAAKSLDMEDLVDLAREGMVRLITNITAEEDWERNLISAKQRDSQEQKKQKDPQKHQLSKSVGKSRSVVNEHSDDRSVDDLVSMINSAGGNTKKASRKESKKKRNKKQQGQGSCSLAKSLENETPTAHHDGQDNSLSVEQYTDCNDEKISVVAQTDVSPDGMGVTQVELHEDDSLYTENETPTAHHDGQDDLSVEQYTDCNEDKISVVAQTDVSPDGMGVTQVELHEDESLYTEIDGEVEELERRFSMSWADRKHEIFSSDMPSQERRDKS